MIKSVKRRNNKIKDFIYNEDIRNLCRLSDKKYKNTFTRNRKISCQDLLLMTLNKQGKNTSFEIRDYIVRKKGDKKVMCTDEAYLKQRRHLNPAVLKKNQRNISKRFLRRKKIYSKKKRIYIICYRWFERGNTKYTKK